MHLNFKRAVLADYYYDTVSGTIHRKSRPNDRPLKWRSPWPWQAGYGGSKFAVLIDSTGLKQRIYRDGVMLGLELEDDAITRAARRTSAADNSSGQTTVDNTSSLLMATPMFADHPKLFGDTDTSPAPVKDTRWSYSDSRTEPTWSTSDTSKSSSWGSSSDSSSSSSSDWGSSSDSGSSSSSD